MDASFDIRSIIPETTTSSVIIQNLTTPVLLLHFDGANGSTTFTDSTGRHVPTPQGSAQLDTSQSVFGPSSGFFGGTGYLSLDGNSDFSLGLYDWTFDCWVRLASVTLGTVYEIIDFHDPNLGTTDVYFFCDGGGATYLRFRSGGSNRIFGTPTIVANTWYHVALTHYHHDIRLFLQGQQVGATWNDSGYDYLIGSNNPTIGAINGGFTPLNGWIDELRIVKGYAAWTSNFTPPTSPYVIYT